ncbi:hypothetical protein ACE14D_19440, partial [Streptomyces sp. Act-28]
AVPFGDGAPCVAPGTRRIPTYPLVSAVEPGFTQVCAEVRVGFCSGEGRWLHTVPPRPGVEAARPPAHLQ